jgi:hypothetical protein
MVPKVVNVKKLKSIATKKNDRARHSARGGFSWRSAISFSAQSTATVLRKTLEELGVRFIRQKSERSYSQLYAVVPFPRVAYVFRFRVAGPHELVIDLYDTYPGTSGALAFMEIPDVNDGTIDTAREILRALASRTPRPPWKFTAAQRLQHGLLDLEVIRARRNWRAIGAAD